MLPKFLRPYAKAVIAVAGVGALVWLTNSGIAIPGLSQVVSDMIVAALVSFGVYQIPNGGTDA